MARPKAAQPGAKATEFERAAQSAGLAVAPGKQAVEGQYRARIATRTGSRFTHSADIDGHFRLLEGAAARWDFAVGIQSAPHEESAYWIEPHPASSTGEVGKMIAKLNWLKAKLNSPEFAALRTLTDVSVEKSGLPYRWLATDGTIRITANSNEARMLARHGLDMPRRSVDLP